MGVVYEAHDPFLDRAVALKVMLPQVAADPEQKLRFEREARAVARLMHPNVVTVFDLGYHVDGSPYIAMEMLRGRDLQQTLREGPPLPLERRLSIVMQVLEGLGHAHAAGIVHRDVKPANVFLGEDGTAKIMDFGVARFTMSSMTSTGVVVGTPDYMSPEQVAAGPIDARSDLFSCGAMLCELVTGRRPFHAEKLLSILYKIANEEPLLSLPPGPEHEALLPVLKKALAKPVEERYQTAAEFANVLRECLKAMPAVGPVVAPRAEPPAAPPATEEPAPVAARPRAAETPARQAPAKDAPATVDFRVPAARPPEVPPIPLPRLPPPNPAGLFAVLREIEAQGKSGHLHFTDGRSRRSLRFSRGEVLYGTSDTAGEHLGDVLVRYGRLTQNDLERAVTTALKERRRVGRVLRELGLLDEGQLQEAVGLHAREILFEATSREGKFSFEESGPDTMSGESTSSELSIVELILEAARRIQDPAEVRAMLGDLDRVLVVAKDGYKRFRHIQLTPADGFLLSRIDGQLTAREVFQLIPLPSENVERSLFSLLSTGVVEYRSVRPATARAQASASAAPHPTGASQAGRELEQESRRREEERRAEELRAEQQRANEPARAALREAHAGLTTKDHFQLLGVPRAATATQVKEAYFRMAKLYHPDTPLDPGLADLRPLRDAVFLRLGEAFETLSKTEPRRRYEARLPRPAPAPEKVAEPAPAAPSESDEAHDAWLARDKLPEAEAHFEAGRFFDAIQVVEGILPRLTGPEQLRASVLLARAQMRNPHWVRRAETSLQELLEQFPRSAEVCVALAELYQANGLRSRAAAMLHRALELEPGNHAVREALTALKLPEGSQPESSSLFKRIFRRP
jgi:serine/threonine-protein kinase